MKKMTKEEAQLNKISIDVGVMLSEMIDIKSDIKVINDKLSSNYATKEWVDLQYGQTKKLVQGFAALILTAVILALIALVVQK
jgi:hypothetical protein